MACKAFFLPATDTREFFFLRCEGYTQEFEGKWRKLEVERKISEGSWMCRYHRLFFVQNILKNILYTPGTRSSICIC